MDIVSVVKCDKYEEAAIASALRDTFENIGGIKKYIKPGMKVVLKPNLVMKKLPEEAATTNPLIVKELARIIIEEGASVTIADSPGGPYTEGALKGVYSRCGIEKVAKEIGANINYDVSEVEVESPNAKFYKKCMVIKPLIDADIVINLPKLKTHGQMVYTGAVKNMFGAIPGLKKMQYHLTMSKYEDFADALIDIFLSIKPTLNIMDAIIGMEGYGPTAGFPKPIGLILASENAFSLDFIALNIINLNPRMVPMMDNAIKRGLCVDNLDNIQVVGEDIKSVRVTDFDVPQIKDLKDLKFSKNRLFKFLLEKLKPKPFFSRDKCVGCGDCAKLCPAKIIQMVDNKACPDISKCIRCFCCQELCPAKAVEIKNSKPMDMIIKLIELVRK